jgi:hypothetical protein
MLTGAPMLCSAPENKVRRASGTIDAAPVPTALALVLVLGLVLVLVLGLDSVNAYERDLPLSVIAYEWNERLGVNGT